MTRAPPFFAARRSLREHEREAAALVRDELEFLVSVENRSPSIVSWIRSICGLLLGILRHRNFSVSSLAEGAAQLHKTKDEKKSLKSFALIVRDNHCS